MSLPAGNLGVEDGQVRAFAREVDSCCSIRRAVVGFGQGDLWRKVRRLFFVVLLR